MRGSRLFRVNVLSRRPPQAHACRMGTWRWSVTIEDQIVSSGTSPTLRAMRKDAREAQFDYLERNNIPFRRQS